MNKTARLLMLLFLFPICCTTAFGQQKYENERRLKSKNVPVEAQTFIDSLAKPNRLKWYLEEGLKSKSIEAKFRHDKLRYSVEFDTLGNIQDIEIEVKWQALQKQVQDSILSQLDRICARSTISKIQIQYIGSQSTLLAYFNSRGSTENLTINYEIIVRCINGRKKELFELLFNENGKLLEKSEIIFQNSSNLEY